MLYGCYRGSVSIEGIHPPRVRFLQPQPEYPGGSRAVTGTEWLWGPHHWCWAFPWVEHGCLQSPFCSRPPSPGACGPGLRGVAPVGGSAAPWGRSLGSAAGAYSVRCEHHTGPARPVLEASQTCGVRILVLKWRCGLLGDSAGRSRGLAPCAARFLGLWSGCTQAGEPHAGRCWEKGGRLRVGPFARAEGAALVDLCGCQAAGDEDPGLWRSSPPAPDAFLSSEPGRPWARGGACGGGWRIPDGSRGAERRHLWPISGLRSP